MWLSHSVASLVVLLGLLGLATQTLLILAAERGRKHDLVRRRPKTRYELNLTIVIPYCYPQQLGDVQHLLRTLDGQQYSRSRVRILLGCTQATYDDIHDAIPRGLPVECLLYPVAGETNEDMVRGWVMERAVATGQNDALIMLVPGDVVKPDFCTQVATLATQTDVCQGYVTTRDADTALEKQEAINKRLFNRVELAGRYHLGLTGQLQRSGWAINPNIVEQLPYGRSTPEGYTLRLLLSGHRVTWAPSMTVFHRLGIGGHLRLFDVVQHAIAAVAERLQLVSTFTAPLWTEGLARPQLSLLIAWVHLFRLPGLLVATLFATFAISDTLVSTPNGMGFTPIWQALLAGMLAVHGLSLWVARCRIGHIAHNMLWAPLLAIGGIALLPVMLLNLIVRQGLALSRRWQHHTASRSSRQATRLNEALPAVTNMVEESASAVAQASQPVLEFITDGGHQPDSELAPSPPHDTETPAVSQTSPIPNLTMGLETSATQPAASVTETVVPISNGKQQVDALLQVHTSTKQDGNASIPYYKMTLAYRTVSFSTQRYRILDQAFYELESKVMSKGLTIVTCGSCGYFYHPTADVADRIQSNGVCLFGKQGREVDLATDAVTVISDACHYHTPLEEREAIVRDWQDSVTLHKQRVI